MAQVAGTADLRCQILYGGSGISDGGQDGTPDSGIYGRLDTGPNGTKYGTGVPHIDWYTGSAHGVQDGTWGYSTGCHTHRRVSRGAIRITVPGWYVGVVHR